jgi:asparagine synthase (glutamine-hydrolysing)
MCGINGAWLFHQDEHDLEFLIRRMNHAIIHRGPDGNSFHLFDNKLVFGHVRLAILDKTESGGQPYFSKSKNICIIFNGEIYNHMQIRALLRFSSWKSHCDTETLVEAIDELGLDLALSHLNGMFSFACYDTRCDRLYLVRDRFGEKPLFYNQSNRGILFSSETKSIAAASFIRPIPDTAALKSIYLHGYNLYSDTPYHNIRSCPPGTYLTIKAGTLCSQTKYWSPINTCNYYSRDDDHFLEKIDFLLDDSVRLRLNSDAPLGVFLSGGIDSSLIATYVAKHLPSRTKTFSLGLVNDSINDESSLAKKFSDQLGTTHSVFSVTDSDIAQAIELLPYVYDAPFPDNSSLLTLLLSRFVSSSISVALSGDGADELFCGYNRYILQHRLDNIPSWLASIALAPLARFLAYIPSHNLDTFESLWRSFSPASAPVNLSDKINTLNNVYGSHLDSQHSSPFSPQISESAVSRRANTCLRDLMWDDLNSYLPNNILVKLDRSTMAYGLEGRLPFLDHRLYELATHLPSSFLIQNNTGKMCLRYLLSKKVQAKDLFAKPKTGFGFSLNSFMRSSHGSVIFDSLSIDSIKNTGFFRPSYVSFLLKEFFSSSRDYSRNLWRIFVIQQWLACQKISF